MVKLKTRGVTTPQRVVQAHGPRPSLLRRRRNVAENAAPHLMERRSPRSALQHHAQSIARAISKNLVIVPQHVDLAHKQDCLLWTVQQSLVARHARRFMVTSMAMPTHMPARTSLLARFIARVTGASGTSAQRRVSMHP